MTKDHPLELPAGLQPSPQLDFRAPGLWDYTSLLLKLPSL